MADVLYNSATREPEPIDDQAALHKALLDGTHSYAAGSMVKVMSPDGEAGTVPAENIRDAVQQGYTVKTPSQLAVDSYVNENKGLRGAVKVGLTQFADEAMLGIPELIYDHKADPLDVAKWEALKKEHDLANTVGGVGGFGASLITGAPLFEGAAKVGEKATEAVAARMMARGAEEAGARSVKAAAKQIVTNIASKAAGGGVEGAMIGMPHAITEAALGEPSDAAESVLFGVGVGTLFGAGGAMAKELIGLGAKVPELVTKEKATVEGIARKVAKVVTGVSEEDILHYVQNADRVNAAPTAEELLDKIAAHHSQATDAVTVAKQKYADAGNELSEAYRGTKFDLSRTRAPLELADEITGALENEKAVLGSLSVQADDALARTEGTISKKDILGFLDKVGGSVGVGRNKALVGEEALKAVSSLHGMRQRIADGLTDEITFPELRDLLKQVRKDINYNQLSGEFNDTLNGLKKEFTSGVSKLLKDRSPEYAGYMERMAAISHSLEEMVPHFGDRQRAIGSLSQLFAKTGAGTVKREAFQKFAGITGQDWLGKVAEFENAQKLLEEARRGDISHKLLPELTAKVAMAKQVLEEAQAKLEPISRLSPERLQGIVRNQGFKNASILDRRALEELGNRAGEDFTGQIQDRNVLDAFGKASTNGSRKTNLFGAIGGMVGGWPGAAAGAGVGATADIYGGQILKRLIDANKDKSGLLFVEKAMKKTADRLDDVPGLLDRMARGVKATKREASTAAILRLLDKVPDTQKRKGEASVPPRIQKLEELNHKAAELVSNQGATAARVAALTHPIGQLGAPNIAGALSNKMTVALNYINSAMPKPPRPRSPFAPEAKWRPSDHELSAYEQKLQVVVDPLSVLTELEHGTLTRNHMDALKSVYPGLHGAIQRKVQSAVIQGVKPLKYPDRVKLSLLMEAPMDTSMTPMSISYYQEPYSQDQPAGEPDQPQPNGFKAKVDVAGGLATDSDRRAGRA